MLKPRRANMFVIAHQHARLVLDEDGQGVFHATPIARSGYSTRSSAAAPAGMIGKQCSCASTRQSTTPVRPKRSPPPALLEIFLLVDDEAAATVGLRERGVVRQVMCELICEKRSSKNMSCHWSDHAEMAVVDQDDEIGSRSSTEVASSCWVIWKQPSPSTQITVASGHAAFAPIAAGMP